MTNVLSKLKVFNYIDHNCYESVHPYDPSCLRVFFLLLTECVKGGFKIYLPIFIIPQLLAIQWRRDKRKIGNDENQNEEKPSESEAEPTGYPDLTTEILARAKRVATKISISTAVLALNSSLVIGLTCVQNKATGKIFYLSPFMSSMVAHFWSFQAENPSRRNAIAMFSIKSCFEIFYRMLEEKSPLLRQHFNEDVGASILFAASLAVNFYLLNQDSLSRNLTSRDPLKSLLSSFVIRPPKQRKEVKEEPIQVLSYALKGSLNTFCIGYAMQLSLNLMRGRISSPLLYSNFKLPLFLSSLVMSYRVTSVLFQKLTRKETNSMNEAAAGFIAGLVSMGSFYPSTQISLYTFWKTAFTLYWMKFGKHRQHAQTILDAIFFFADSFLINCMVMEPHYVPRSYLKFIDSITGSYLRQFNIISHYLLTERTQYARYGDSLPQNLDVSYLSPKYLELTASWALESMK